MPRRHGAATPEQRTALPTPRVLEGAASLGGLALAGVFGTVAALRRGRPLHPHGATYSATVTMTGAGLTGVPWLDEPGTHEVTARVSRSVGLPRHLRRVRASPLRVALDGSVPADVLFASTGDSATGRFVFRPRFGVHRGPLTTLLPVRSARGALLLRLLAAGPGPMEDLGLPASMVLSAAHGTGPWHEVGILCPGPARGPGVVSERHDPVVAELPGTEQYAVVRRLREPAYVAARKVSG